MDKALADDRTLLAVLRERFAHDRLRPGQHAIIRDVLAGETVVAVMPTGAGKSLCYQLPAVVLGGKGGFALVVSPLIALMKDQVDGLRARGIATAALTSAASADEQRAILSSLRAGELTLLYIAPERFQSQRFTEALQSVADRLMMLAIDEAHCISEWGHDFRPAYRMLGAVVRDLRPPRILAVTATATPEVQLDIVEQLGIESPTLHVRGFARAELTFAVHHTGGAKDKSKRLVELVTEVPHGSVLVYAATRKNAERYADDLRAAGIAAGVYHAGMDERQRTAVQDAFMSDELRVIVATNAFGMGVDKTEIRRVIHADLPRSIEAYYQEAGRAGRDGQPADCVLLFNHGDVRLQEFLIDASFPSAELLRELWRYLRARDGSDLGSLALAGLPGEPHESTLRSACQILVRHGYAIDEAGLLSACQPGDRSGDFPEFDPEAPQRRASVERSKLRKMVDYAYHTGCRHRFVLDYFGDQERHEDCSSCDNCLGESSHTALTDQQLDSALKLLQVVAVVGGRFGRRRIAAIANGSDDDPRFYELEERGSLRGETQQDLLDLIRSLEAAGYLEQGRGDYPTLSLTASGKRVAQGKAQIGADELRLGPRRGKAKAAKKNAARPSWSEQADPDVTQRLAALRQRLAKERAVPAYVIFSNRTLEELACARPTSMSSLGQVHGIGASRLESLGEEILRAIIGE